MKRTVTVQEVFDAVWQAFVVEGRPFAVSPDKNEHGVYPCLYRGPNGTKCAIGLIIPDEEYDPEFENERANTVLRKLGYDFEPLLVGYLRIDADSVQLELHDEPARMPEFDQDRERLRYYYRGVAAKWGLTVPSTIYSDGTG